MRERLPTPVFWPGEFCGFHSPWGRKELDMTESLSLGTENICAPKEIYGSLSYILAFPSIRLTKQGGH